MGRPIDRQTVDQLVVEHLPAALRLATRLAGDRELAEDLVQEALCRILDRWQSFRGEAEFRTWMLQVVVNVDRDRRRRRVMGELTPEDVVSPVAEPDAVAAATELGAIVRHVIDQLPARQREVALLCVGEGLNAAEVAAILETTEANVHTCLHLARKRIAQALGVKMSGGI